MLFWVFYLCSCIFVFSFFLSACQSLCFFFFKQKTAYELRISDWSSDVCSSDLAAAVVEEVQLHLRALAGDVRQAFEFGDAFARDCLRFAIGRRAREFTQRRHRIGGKRLRKPRQRRCGRDRKSVV